jgi:hypothetical protein
VNRGDVPRGCRPVLCLACGGYLAVPIDAGRAVLAQAMRDHTLLEHRRNDPPRVVFHIGHGGGKDPLNHECPAGDDGAHCNHWEIGYWCCGCGAPTTPGSPKLN